MTVAQYRRCLVCATCAATVPRIPSRVADALPAFNLIPCPARLSLRPPRTRIPRPHVWGRQLQKEDFLSPLPGLVERARPMARPGHTSPFLRAHSPFASIIPGRDSQCRRSVAPAGKAVYAGGKRHGRSSMPKLRLLLCCLALLFLAAPAMAEEDELAPGFDRCMEQSGGVTSRDAGLSAAGLRVLGRPAQYQLQKGPAGLQKLPVIPRLARTSCSKASGPGSSTRKLSPIWCSCPTKAAVWPV